jgi:hypothetical protein
VRAWMKWTLAVAMAAFVPAHSAAKDRLETTHLFGFTLGSDVNDVGEREAESETVGRFGKDSGSYSALSHALGVKFIPFQNFSIEPVANIAYHDISGVPGLDDRRQAAFDAFSVEMRYRVLNREHAPFGLTLGFDPRWSRVDEISAEPVNQYAAAFWLIADKEIIADRVFTAVNLTYEPDASRSRITGEWEHQSGFSISGAVTGQVWRDVLIGAEARYLRSYDGLGLDRLSGEALFVGPTFYALFSERFWMGAAWSVQVAGRPAREPGGALDLAKFERHQGLLRFGYNF